MVFPERFSALPAYAFPRLRALLDGVEPGAAPIAMSLGEPKHAPPAWLGEEMARHTGDFTRYPPNEGTPALREAIAGWVARRYAVTLDPGREILPLNGTREGLYAAALALVPEAKGGGRSMVALPNPFYPVYAVGALTLGAEPLYLAATAATGFLPDLEAFARRPDVERVSLFFLCSPGNPQGAVAGLQYWARLLDLAERHDFIVVADECYSEIWRDAPPPGALQVAEAIGADRARIVAIQSLSKRSNLPGLRSGFAAGSAEAIGRMLQLRAYAGAPLPLPVQHVSARAWADEAHVDVSRLRYAAKYAIAEEVLGGMPGYVPPEAGFFLWIAVEDGEDAALRLWREAGVRVLPGGYLAREVDGQNPGRCFVRAAMVAGEDEIRDGLVRLRACLGG